LSDYLPRSYGLGNGEIIDTRGATSKEVDIAACNQFHPYTYSRGGQGLLFIEGVEAVVEAKSVLNEKHLEQSIKNCKSVRTLHTNILAGTMAYEHGSGTLNRSEITPYAIFAFESPYTIRTLGEKLMQLNQELCISDDERIDLIFSLDRGLIADNKEYDHIKIGDQSGISSGYTHVDIEPQLLMFLILLQDKMPQVSSMPNILKQYMDVIEMN
jgi:hypothetical protein